MTNHGNIDCLWLWRMQVPIRLGFCHLKIRMMNPVTCSSHFREALGLGKTVQPSLAASKSSWSLYTVYTVPGLHFVRSYDPFFLALNTFITAPNSAAATPRQIAGIMKSFQPNGWSNLFSVMKNQREIRTFEI